MTLGDLMKQHPTRREHPMSITFYTMPTVGDRAIITAYGYRTPATFVEECDRTHASWATSSHWCFDEPTSSRFTWTSRPDVAREPILEPPMSTDTPTPEREGTGEVMATSENRHRAPEGHLLPETDPRVRAAIVAMQCLRPLDPETGKPVEFDWRDVAEIVNAVLYADDRAARRRRRLNVS